MAADSQPINSLMITPFRFAISLWHGRLASSTTFAGEIVDFWKLVMVYKLPLLE
jgi:hypothetical protein